MRRDPGPGSVPREPGRRSRHKGPCWRGPTSSPGRQAARGAGPSEPCRNPASIQSEPVRLRTSRLSLALPCLSPPPCP
eukprot:12924595-Prorocentrum_lima.AAC.1